MNRPVATIASAVQLVDAGLIAPAESAAIGEVSARYAIAIPPALAALIDRNDPNDPIARQFVPNVRELITTPNEREDPIGDRDKSPSPGLVHRYADRVLIKIASVCPVYCRFCFRREMVGPDLGEAMSADDVADAIAYIARTPAIWEVILTGGDPFILSPRRIRDVTTALGGVRHVKVLRWHTRVPVADPARISDELVSALRASGKVVYVGLHTNHARELTKDAEAAIARLVDAGIPVVSQTVLLRGVNDSTGALEDLMRRLVETRVTPYYLHHGDMAPGTSHLRVTLLDGLSLMRELRQRLSGLAMPAYVLDIPGAYGKVAVAEAVTPQADGSYLVRDSAGRLHVYRDG